MPHSTVTTATVTRRKVFYIPGFDPAPPRRYRELYRREARVQGEISGYAIEMNTRNGPGSFGWSVTAIMDGHRVRSEFEVLVWSDIVRASMHHGIAATYLQLVRTTWIYVSSGALMRLMRLRKGPIIAALYPIVALLLQSAIAIALATGLAVGLVWAFPLPFVEPASVALGFITAVLIFRLFRGQDYRLFVYYLMHDYAFTAGSKGAYPAALEARIATFAAVIRTALSDDCDEVLLIGHSSGVHLAVSILADLTRDGLPATRSALGFLSLGHVVPMVSFLPDAHRLRADLHDLSVSDDLTWVDVTAPGDGCAFALCDPVAVTGVGRADKQWPLVLSAAFSQTLSPARWKALRWRFFRLHFQYLCAFDQPAEYDYFRITAGPQTLASRFSGRSASKNRIDTPTSGYTSRAA